MALFACRQAPTRESGNWVGAVLCRSLPAGEWGVRFWWWLVVCVRLRASSYGGIGILGGMRFFVGACLQANGVVRFWWWLVVCVRLRASSYGGIGVLGRMRFFVGACLAGEFGLSWEPLNIRLQAGSYQTKTTKPTNRSLPLHVVEEFIVGLGGFEFV